MADNLSREERVAAGLKKLKRFQQRTGRKNPEHLPKKKPFKESLATAIKEQPPEKQQPASEASEQQATKVNSSFNTEPANLSTSNSSSHDTITSISNSSFCTSTSEANSTILVEEKSKQSNSIGKSKSDLDLANIKELSSTESLLQISQQINGLMSETHAFLNGNIEQDETMPSPPPSENQSLEIRNQQLASQIDHLRQSNDHLQFQIQESKAKNARLLREFEAERQTLQDKAHKEQVALKDQLQVHIQTIGILVAEKTELQSSLSLHQQTAKQKAAEVEEFQGRLRASRQRANDLERDLNNLSSSNQQFEKGNKEFLKEIDRLKLDNYKLSKNIEELKQQNAELSEKLNKKISEHQALEDELADTRSKLSLAELYANQVSQGKDPEYSSQLEDLHHQNLELEKKVSLHKESVEKLISERDQMSSQYQSFVDELSQKVTSLRDELKEVSNERELAIKEKDALFDKLESFKSQQVQNASLKEDSIETKMQLSTLEEQNANLKTELDTQVSDNAQMSQLVQEQQIQIMELESSLQRLKEQEVDTTHLLDTMQSDKIAAKRAVAQNRELKKQLEELQSGFVVMSHDKLQLTEKLHGEQHITKELGERLSQQEEELLELKEQLAVKENELRTMEISNTKGIYQQNQIADRMRHYEAQGHVAEMLQQELSQAKERIDSLENQNKELRMSLARQAETTITTDGATEDKDAEKRNTLVASLSTSVRQLEMERNQMMKQLDEQKMLRTKLEEQLKSTESQISYGADNGSIISKEEYEMLKNAMQQLEDRFKKTMNEIADLSDEKQRLEHLVLQLQGETDTIGDYIALYQTQRGLMQKRASEKDEYIQHLAKDREDLKTKLGELQELVRGLLDERKQLESLGQITPDNTSDWFSLSKDKLTKTQSADPGVPSTGNGKDADSNHGEPHVSGKQSTTTAKKIMDLLTEIETTNFVERPVLDNFHPCPVCSGRLITV